MNLLMISGDRSIPSGRKGAFWYTLEELRKHFERIDVICPRANNFQFPIHVTLSRVEESNFQNVYFHPSHRELWYQPFWILQKGKELILKHHHDVMTVHDYPPFYNGIGARWIHHAMGIPYALEVHHVVGHPKPEGAFERIGRWLYHSPFFFLRTARHARRIRAVNHEVAELLAAWGLEHSKIAVVPSLYLDAASLTPEPNIQKRYDLVTSAWLAPHKGIGELLEAVVLLPGVSLLVCGDGPERPKLEARACSLGIADRVEFRGWLPEQHDLFRAMQEGKVFVMNSRSEGNPRVAVEAMALGIPVVSTRVGIMPEFPEDLVAFTDGTPQGIAAALHPLLADSVLREERGKSSREVILQRFAPGIAITAYAKFLQSLVCEPEPEPESSLFMTLLFITQKLHGQDAFALLWIREFEERGYKVIALCLENSVSPQNFEILSMGKEKGAGKLRQTCAFYQHIMTARYDRVFIHMSPVWYALGFWWWLLRGIPVYLWYTHYKMQLGVRLFGWFGRRFFCATSQSLPQYEGSPKKVVTGHGVDLTFWVQRPNRCGNPHALLVVHRLSRSKRLEIGLRALALLPEDYTMTIYGLEAEPDYVTELRALVTELGLTARVTWKGSIPMEALREVYPRYQIILNMASETIDKTMLEAMTCGCYPVTTRRNVAAIGLKDAPPEDTPEAVAAFIRNFQDADPPNQSKLGSEQANELYCVVAEGHSLAGLVARMEGFIVPGT